MLRFIYIMFHRDTQNEDLEKAAKSQPTKPNRPGTHYYNVCLFLFKAHTIALNLLLLCCS